MESDPVGHAVERLAIFACISRGVVPLDEEGLVNVPAKSDRSFLREDAPTRSDPDLVAFRWRIGRTAPSRDGSETCQCQLVAHGPVSASSSRRRSRRGGPGCEDGPIRVQERYPSLPL